MTSQDYDLPDSLLFEISGLQVVLEVSKLWGLTRARAGLYMGLKRCAYIFIYTYVCMYIYICLHTVSVHVFIQCWWLESLGVLACLKQIVRDARVHVLPAPYYQCSLVIPKDMDPLCEGVCWAR